MPASTNWVGYISAGCLVALSFLAVFLVKRNKDLPQVLPPIATIDVQSGYVGQHDFGAWRLICNPVAPAQTPAGAANAQVAAAPELSTADQSSPRCHMRSQLAMKQGEALQVLAATYVFFRSGETEPNIAIILPAAAKAGKVVHFGVDENKAFESAIVECNEKQCITRGQLPDGAIGLFLGGRELRIRFTVAENRTPVFPMKLHGFKEAYAGLRSGLGLAPHAEVPAAAAPAPAP